MSTLYTAPEVVPDNLDEPVSVFLAGSIEQGAAEEWQEKIIKEIKALPVAVYNPRRDNWDPSWVQSINNKKFYEQVSWELDQLAAADIVFFYFDPSTKSPVTLLELGLIIGNLDRNQLAPVIVVCPDGYWRQGNIEIMCARSGVMFVRSLDAGLDLLKETIFEQVQSLIH